MISLLPIGQVIGLISVIYAVFIALAVAISWRFGDHPQTVWGSIGFAFSGATALQLLLKGVVLFRLEAPVEVDPGVEPSAVPGHWGEWEIRINWHGEGNHGVVNAEATVRQDFLRISMEVRSAKSDSQTLIAQPKKDPESGRPLLYYVYLVTPKAVGANPSPPYNGAAILKFSETGAGQLSGNYWTSQRTAGHFTLSRRT